MHIENGLEPDDSSTYNLDLIREDLLGDDQENRTNFDYLDLTMKLRT